MQRTFLALVSTGLLFGCGKQDNAALGADSASRDIQLPAPDSTVALNDAPPNTRDTVFVAVPTPPPSRPPAARPAPAPAPAPAPSPAAPAPAPLPAPPPRLSLGSTVDATALASITSKTNKPGETFIARIPEAVRTADGQVVIPAGSDVVLSIVALKPAPNKSAKDGTIQLRAVSVMVNGESKPLDADVSFVEHTLKARGVGTSEIVKGAGGAAAGAILGKVVGGGTGAAVGAVVGAAAGTAVAVETADRDVVVPVGAKITLVLRSPFPAA